jgi:MurNAc alpha-1-phosphate uridylyltransferase
LIPLAGQPLIVHGILACKQAGITQIIINLSYKSEMIRQALGDGSRWSVNIEYSLEGEPPLETAGGIVKALPLFENAPFIAMSGDIWTNYDLSQLASRIKTLKLAHLIMVPNPDFKTQGDFVLMPHGVLSDEGSDRCTYGNIGLFHPDLFKDLPGERLGLGKLLYRYLDSGQITGELYTGEWFNIGTAEQLTQAEHMLKETL